MSANEKHKNSMFSLLFSDPDILRQLYSAIESVELPPDTAIDINTLSNALFMGQINDVSFTVGDRLIVLIEHQSTINENMPLRLLMYVARVYEKIIDRIKVYKTDLVKIPEPIFIVLYNGRDPYPEHEVLRLSDAFRDTAGLRAENPGGSALELVVHVYNINQGYNSELLGKCEALGGYSVFVSKVWEYRGTMDLEDAMKAAIRYCIENNILRLFFESNSSEVMNMFITSELFDSKNSRNKIGSTVSLPSSRPPDSLGCKRTTISHRWSVRAKALASEARREGREEWPYACGLAWGVPGSGPAVSVLVSNSRMISSGDLPLFSIATMLPSPLPTPISIPLPTPISIPLSTPWASQAL
ncbi:MAG: Rpn family recombination-promoting nuclease/putative transposase [Treponema sp.]|nr:Rpn family recombination-promoting nuclease/putative transposase [Treponema sp.]